MCKDNEAQSESQNEDSEFHEPSVKPNEICSQIAHIVSIGRDNAQWHLSKYFETKDKYYLGQWKAYSRMAKRSSSLEVCSGN